MRPSLFVFFFFLSLNATSQILNIDKNEVGEKNKKWLLNSSLALASDQQKYNVFDILFTSDISYKHDKRRYVFYCKIDHINDGNEQIQNAGCLQFRDRIGVKKKLSMDYFTQTQWNGEIGMVNRSLAGANLILQVVNNDTIDFFTGVGIFYEHELWNYNGVLPDKVPASPHDVDIEHPRLNLTAKYARTFSKRFDVVVRIFVQPTVFERAVISRSSLAFQLNMPLSKRLVLVTNAEGTYDTHPMVPIRNFLYGFSQSVALAL